MYHGAVNHLAHLLLAGTERDEIVGALMGDHVRGRIEGRFRPGLRFGIRLHRRIDAFTDAHELTLASRRRIRPALRRYAGVVVDLAYDHYLARHWRRFSEEPFAQFADRVYAALEAGRPDMPEPLYGRLPRMIADDFLRRSFALRDLEYALHRLGGRLRRPVDLTPAVADLVAADAALEADFRAFFPQLVEHCGQQRRELRGERPVG